MLNGSGWVKKKTCIKEYGSQVDVYTYILIYTIIHILIINLLFINNVETFINNVEKYDEYNKSNEI